MSKENRLTLSRRDFLKTVGLVTGSIAIGGVGGYILGKYQPRIPNVPAIGDPTPQPQSLEEFPIVESGFEEEALQKVKSRFLILDREVRKSENPQKFPSWVNQETGEAAKESPIWSDALYVGMFDLLSKENPDFFQPLVKFYTDLLIADGGTYQKLLKDKSPDIAWTSFLTLVPTFEITGDEKYKNLALDAANFLVDSLYDEKTGLFPTSNNSDQYVVNSTLTVTPLLFWASKHAKDNQRAQKYNRVAIEYLENAIKLFSRPDGSVFHAVEKSSKGQLIKGETKNPTGYRNSTRVLGAFIFALANAYKENPQRKDFLQQAMNSLESAMNNTPKTMSIPFDIGPIPQNLEKYKDTSGQSAIACSALELASLIDDPLTRKTLTNYGRGLLKDIAGNHMTKYGGVANALQGYWAIRDFENGKTTDPIQIETINGDYWFALGLQKSSNLV